MKRFKPFVLSKKAVFAKALLAVAGLSSGCMQLQDLRIESQQRRLARSAWGSCGNSYVHVAHSPDFRQGFEEGYYDVASGGDGCPPALPPKKYWGAAYQSPGGQEHTKAWFAGFREGAEAAKRDGVQSYGSIYISPEHRTLPDNGTNPQNMAEPSPLQPVPVPGSTMNAIPNASPSAPAPLRIDVLPPLGYQPPQKAQAPIDLKPAPAPMPLGTPPVSPPPKTPMPPPPANTTPPPGKESMALLAPPAPLTTAAAIQPPMSSTARLDEPMPTVLRESVPTTQAKWPVTAPATKTTTLKPAETPVSGEEAFKRDWQPVMPNIPAEPKPATVVQPAVTNSALPTANATTAPVAALPTKPATVVKQTPATVVKQTPATVVKEPAAYRPAAPVSTVVPELLEPPAPPKLSASPVYKAPVPTTPTKPAVPPPIVKQAAAVEVNPAKPTPPTSFVKPDADLPVGFVPEVLMGEPRKLNPDGTFVP